jgi:uncharacterized protein
VSGFIEVPPPKHSTYRDMKLLRLLATLSVIVGLATAAAQDGPQPRLPTVKLTAGMHVITAEVAATPATRSRGLMFRESLAPNHGMLFMFEHKSTQCFWMRNTPLPLTIAFIEDDGTIVQLNDMKPKSDTGPCSEQPVRYALEMERGWFAKRGLAVGARIGGLPPRASIR